MSAGVVAVIVSPAAGSGRGAGVGAAVVRGLRARGHDVVDVSAGTAVGTLDAARRAVTAGARALVAVGGDGTVQLGASAVAGTGVPLAVVPAGSGNDAARALEVTPLGRGDDPSARAVGRLQELLAAGAAGDAVDLLRVRAAGAGVGHPVGDPVGGAGARDRWVVGVVAAGFDAAVNARANAWSRAWAARGRRLPGRARYTAAVLRELPAWRPRPYRLVLDGVPREVEAVLVAVAGTHSYGGGLRIAPRAVPDDGLADVVVVGALTRPGLLAMMPTVFAGLHTLHPAVSVHRAARVEVQLAGPDARLVAHGDGEPLGGLPLGVEVVPGALRLLR